MINRRNFIKSAAAASGLMLLPAWAAGKGKGPNSKFNVAIIGVGGRGGSAVKAFMESPEVNVAAFCDVDDDRAAGFYKKYPNVQRFRDFRSRFFSQCPIRAEKRVQSFGQRRLFSI